MSRRTLALAALLACGVMLALALERSRAGSPLGSSLAPALELLGAPVQALDRVTGELLPVDEIDERELGLELRKRYESGQNPTDRDSLYVNELLAEVARRAQRPFSWKAFVVDEEASVTEAFADRFSARTG